MRFVLLCTVSLPLLAQEWSAITRQDVAGMDQAIRTYYAGAVDPENLGFESNWTSALRLAEQRAATVTTEAGYRATIRALANSARDGHVFVNFTNNAPALRWPGIALELRNSRYLLRTLPGSELDVPDGALLISCDGKPIDEYARERLDLFVANWEIPARRIAAAAQFFLDTGNPFVPLPQSCEYRREPSLGVLKLEYKEVSSQDASAAIVPFRRIMTGRSQFTLGYKSDGSAWLTIPNLSQKEPNLTLIQQARGQRNKIVSAPYIVVDVRGNGGGDSSYGDLLARVLWGDQSLKPGAKQSRPKSWRVNASILEFLRSQREKNPVFYDRILPRMEKALAEKKDFVADHDPEGGLNLRRAPARPLPTPPVFILTDGGCFSSCILMVNLFRRMGAIQVGDPTDQNAIYGENAYFRDLPSGRAKLSIPLAYFGLPKEELGGGAPDLPWDGDATDQAGIEEMIRQKAAKIRSSAGIAAPAR